MTITPDSSGSPIGLFKLTPEKSYVGVPDLLQRYIRSEYLLLSGQLTSRREKKEAQKEMTRSWKEITRRIEYTYKNMKKMFKYYWREDAAKKAEILADVAAGKKLALKPNLTIPLEDIDPVTWGAGNGWGGSTAWPFMAALIRYFHDEMDIDYAQMLVCDGPDKQTFDVSFLQRLGAPLTSTAILEGRVVDPGQDVFWYGGYGFYFVRKYLSEKAKNRDSENPMNGYFQGITGQYYPPGQANFLALYDLNIVNDGTVANGRARRVDVPSHAYRDQDKVWMHKAVIGDPADTANYPGSFLVNVAKLKVHPFGYSTLCIKNLFGLPPQGCGHDASVVTTDHLVGTPAKSPGVGYTEHQGLSTVIKNTTPHDPHYAPRDVNGFPIINADGTHPFGYRYDFRFQPYPGATEKVGPNNSWGIDGTTFDYMKMLVSEGVNSFHMIDAILGANEWHEASGVALLAINPTTEGLVAISSDPVAIDKCMTRYMFKKVPRNEAAALGAVDLYSGTGDSLAVSGSTVTLASSGAGFAREVVKKNVIITGCTNGGNNGTFPITKWVDADTIEFTNASGVDETSAFTWKARYATEFLQVSPRMSFTVDGTDLRLDSAFSVEDTVDVLDFRTDAAKAIGLGDTEYYIIGRDVDDGGKIISLGQHIGKLVDDVFQDLITPFNYRNIQPAQTNEASFRSWFEASDALTTALLTVPLPLLDYPSAIEALHGHEVSMDSDGDGRISSIDYPQNAMTSSSLGTYAHYLRAAQLKMLDNGVPPTTGAFKGNACWQLRMIAHANTQWNASGHYTTSLTMLNFCYLVAAGLAFTPAPVGGYPDLFPNTTWGQWVDGGNEIIAWPTIHFAVWFLTITFMYGGPGVFDGEMDDNSVWGLSWAYAMQRVFGGDVLLDRSAWPYQTATEYYQALLGGAPPVVDFTVKVPWLAFFGLPNTALAAPTGADAFTVAFGQPADQDYEVWPQEVEWPALGNVVS